MLDLEEARDRLREWAFYFRDVRRKGKAGSAEGNWRSPQVWETPKPRPAFDLRRALHTWELIRALPSPGYRVLTARYCYPFVPIHLTLRLLSRRVHPFTHKRITLKEYEELVAIAEHRLAAALYNEEVLTYSPRPTSGASRAITV